MENVNNTERTKILIDAFNQFLEWENPEILGIALARALKWEGETIFCVALAALEDSNFHRASRELINAWEKIEGPINANI